eukprot:snap_masked-scaffold_56-processed-gene-1.35-mRNA-1 protein AED:0.78 eAED:1.00 QI:0/-1/0/1/-1/1/1/0/92
MGSCSGVVCRMTVVGSMFTTFGAALLALILLNAVEIRDAEVEDENQGGDRGALEFQRLISVIAFTASVPFGIGVALLIGALKVFQNDGKFPR